MPARADDTLLVFAAASTTNAIQDIAAAFAADGLGDVTPVFDATSRAARQIEQGAPAHVLVSANAQWASWLIECGPGDAATRRTIARNGLVLIEPAASEPTEDLLFNVNHPALAARRFAIADPAGVPAGVYAQQALEAIGAWEALSPRLLLGDNVRTVLGWVAAGAADAGIVYATDAAISGDVRVRARIPEASHAPIIYEALATKNAPARASAFIDYLQSAKAQTIFAKYGFLPASDADETALAPTAAECG